jgi:hypothetical protein
MIPSKLLDKHFKPLVVTTSMVSLGTFVLGLGELFSGLPNRFFLGTKYFIDRPSNKVIDYPKDKEQASIV